MRLIKSTIDDLLDQLRVENPKFNVPNDKIIVNGPYPNDGTHGAVKGERVINVGVTADTGLVNTVNVGYDRLQLSELKRLLYFKVRVPEGVASTYGALPYIEGYYRLGITEADVEDVPIYLDDYMNRHLVLRSTSSSVGWRGEVDLEIMTAPESITSLIVESDLGDYGVQETAKAYSYPFDFTDQFDVLSSVSTINPQPAKMATVLKSVTGDNWDATPGYIGAFSYADAAVTFAGINMAKYGGNPNYKYLIIVNLSSANCTNLAGQLYIHYNDPIEAIDPDQV